MNENFNPMFGLDEAEEEDEDDYVIGDFQLVCNLPQNVKCTKDGKCVILNPATGEMDVCEHLSVDDPTTFEANN